jgi:hypothetical protein
VEEVEDRVVEEEHRVEESQRQQHLLLNKSEDIQSLYEFTSF